MALDPFLVEESTFVKLVPPLEEVVKLLDENATHHDHLVALLIVLLAETGFYASPQSEPFYSKRYHFIRRPKDWKSPETGVYEIVFVRGDVSGEQCKLVVIPSGDRLIINFYCMKKEKKVYSMVVQTLKYVNTFSSDLGDRYINLREIAHNFKNAVATPVCVDVKHAAGMVSPCLQGLPPEIKMKILQQLNDVARTRLAQCCQEFGDLISGQT